MFQRRAWRGEGGLRRRTARVAVRRHFLTNAGRFNTVVSLVTRPRALESIGRNDAGIRSTCTGGEGGCAAGGVQREGARRFDGGVPKAGGCGAGESGRILGRAGE